MTETRHYNAFISYRHLEIDSYVAEKLQKLLENYKPPKGVGETDRIQYIFLDRSELPTSKSLDQSLKDALFNSDYLIVILSEHYKDSIWCMEEVRAFKEHCGGKIDRILPVLVSGEPAEALPEEICFEEYYETAPDGTQQKVRKILEPLCCDVRADSKKERDRKLKTEFLRLAAPMLGCGFDDLYQRHRKQQRRRQAIAIGSAFGILTAILAVVLVSYHEVSVSRRQYRESLLTSYTQAGMERSCALDESEAMAYFAKVLRDDPANQNAARSALIELQKQGWIYLEDTSDSSALSFPEAKAEPVISADERTIVVTMPDGTEYEMPSPVRVSTNVNDDRAYNPNYVYKPSVLALSDEYGTRFAVYFGGILYLYEPYGAPGSTGRIECAPSQELDIAKVAAEQYNTDNMDLVAQMYASPSNTLIGVRSGYGFAMVDAVIWRVHHAWDAGPYTWRAVMFSPNEDRYAVCRFASTDFGNNGPLVEIFNMDGQSMGTSRKDTRYDFVGGGFSADGSEIMWARTNRISILNGNSADDVSVQLMLEEPITDAVLMEDGSILTKTRNGAVRKYRAVYFDVPVTDADIAKIQEVGNTQDQFIDDALRNALEEKLGRTIVSYKEYDGGYAVAATGGSVFVFRDGESEPYKTIETEHGGAINQIAIDGKGLLAVDLTQDNGDIYLEIWDYEQGMHITNIQPPFLVLDLCFADDGCLMYRHYAPAYNTELVKKWAVDAPAPDETVVEMLESLTSCELDENLVPVIKDPAFAQDLGSWATVFK